MPRPRPRSTHLETRAARLRLKVRGKPYYVSIAPLVDIGYRRTKKIPGPWVVKSTDGHGGEWIKNFGHADDIEDADGEHIFDFWQASERAKKLVRGNGDSAPPTVERALDDYQADLAARGGALINASRVRRHVTSSLAAKPVALLTATELARWRNGLLAAGLKPATVLRTCKSLAAALNYAARHDSRIVNRDAWRIGLGGLADTYNVRNTILPDPDVRAIVAAAYEVDSTFGLYVEVHAVTGGRSSQIAALTVADLQVDRSDPRLLMPGSRKGRGRKAGTRRPVPIGVTLSAKLGAVAAGRSPAEPLLLRQDGRPWRPSVGDHSRLFAQAAERAALKGCTIYALRHSSIVRSLLAGTPVRITAVVHDTSVGMIERTYSHFIADHADEHARRGLLDIGEVVP